MIEISDFSMSIIALCRRKKSIPINPSTNALLGMGRAMIGKSLICCPKQLIQGTAMTDAMSRSLAVMIGSCRRMTGVSTIALTSRSDRAVKVAPVSISNLAVMIRSLFWQPKAAFVQSSLPWGLSW